MQLRIKILMQSTKESYFRVQNKRLKINVQCSYVEESIEKRKNVKANPMITLRIGIIEKAGDDCFQLMGGQRRDNEEYLRVSEISPRKGVRARAEKRGSK